MKRNSGGKETVLHVEEKVAVEWKSGASGSKGGVKSKRGGGKVVEVAGRQRKLQPRDVQKGTHLYGKLRSLMKFKRVVTGGAFVPENKIREKNVVLSVGVWRRQSEHAVTR